jgi:hypothetical protein
VFILGSVYENFERDAVAGRHMHMRDARQSSILPLHTTG